MHIQFNAFVSFLVLLFLVFTALLDHVHAECNNHFRESTVYDVALRVHNNRKKTSRSLWGIGLECFENIIC